MIPLDDFKILPFDKKCDFVTIFADYISCREKEDHKFYLYYLNGFFVEVNYSPSKGEVFEICAFKNVELAQSYLEQINISDLFNFSR